MAQLSKPPIPYKVFRYFAAVTVMLTATLAVFAQEAPKHSASTTPTEADATASSSSGSRHANKGHPDEPAFGQPEFVVKRGSFGAFGDEAGPGSGYGRPHVSHVRNRLLSYSELPAANSENAAFTQAYLDSLSDEELAALLEALRASGIQSSTDRERIASVMEAASRRRSGHGQRSSQE